MAKTSEEKKAEKQQEMNEVLHAYGGIFKTNTRKSRIDETEEKDEDFEIRFNGYIERFCVQKNMKPSLEGFCAYAGIDIIEYKKWANGAILVSERRSWAIRQINAILLACLNEFTSMGKINTVYAIFILKNNFGYEDKQEKVVTQGKKLLHKQKSNAEIEEVLKNNSASNDIYIEGTKADKE